MTARSTVEKLIEEWERAGRAIMTSDHAAALLRDALDTDYGIAGIGGDECPACGGNFAALFVRGRIGYHAVPLQPGIICSGVGQPQPR